MRISKLLTGAAAAVTLALALPACAQPAPSATNDADPALWVVKDDDTTVYLFGTVHVLKPGLSWFDEAVKTAFDGSQQLVLEMVLPEPATAQKVIMAKGMAPAGTPALSERLPEDARAGYTNALAGLGVPAAAFDRMKPWFAAMNLTMLPLMKSGYAADSGPEMTLSAAAKTSGKTIAGLETFEGQMDIFDGLSQPAQMEFLTSTVRDLPKLDEQMATMVADWAKGDPDALARLLNENMKDSPETTKALLTDRNARWADWVAERMKQPGTVFVAVGAGHLAGEGSVQTFLARHKLQATRISY